MGLLRLLGIKPSAGSVANVVSSELEKVMPFYNPRGHLNQLGPVVYSQGGCSCGCAPEFQFYYDGKNLAVLPCFFDSDSLESLQKNKVDLVKSIKKRLGVDRVDLVLRSEQPPKYMAQYAR